MIGLGVALTIALHAAEPAATEAALRLLQDGALRQRLRQGGYQFLGTHHTLGAAQAAMRKVLER